MTPRPRRGRRAGTTSLEFAMCASALILVCFGVMNVGVLLWTHEALQSAAAQTARCAALGSTLCSNAQQYAVDTAAAFTFTGVIATGDVWVQGNTTCASTSGHVTAGKYTVVTIVSHYWSTGLLPIPLGNKTLTATACYPSAA
jgi:Flp pilus assembly protein TadG